jgi:hypothetical protein
MALYCANNSCNFILSEVNRTRQRNSLVRILMEQLHDSGYQ